MKVWIDVDEWFPVYHLVTDDIPDWAYEDGIGGVVEMDMDKYADLKKRYDLRARAFQYIQEELRQLLEKEWLHNEEEK
jgi:hypothetical protein